MKLGLSSLQKAMLTAIAVAAPLIPAAHAGPHPPAYGPQYHRAPCVAVDRSNDYRHYVIVGGVRCYRPAPRVVVPVGGTVVVPSPEVVTRPAPVSVGVGITPNGATVGVGLQLGGVNLALGGVIPFGGNDHGGGHGGHGNDHSYGGHSGPVKAPLKATSQRSAPQKPQIHKAGPSLAMD